MTNIDVTVMLYRDGVLVANNIDEVDSGGETTAVLGKAVLGQMILGQA